MSEVNVVQGKIQGWWYNTCPTIHVSYDRSLFKTFDVNGGEQEIQMGIKNRSKVLAKGSIELFHFGKKKITLTNVLYVSKINQSLVSCALLGKPGIKVVYESRKLILSRSGSFVRKCCVCDGMVKLCTIDNDNNKSNSSSLYD